MTSHSNDYQDIELDLLLEAIYRVYHQDFRKYSRSSLCRAVARTQGALGTSRITEVLDRIVHDRQAFGALLGNLTIQTSDLFRDPSVYHALRKCVVPELATYPFIRIWVAGCSTGEEAYSLAIFLHEEGLLKRALIYATDINAESLRVAESAVYKLRQLQGFSQNYFQAGGRGSLADYYTTAYSHATFSSELRKHVLFSDHSLTTDAAFAEVQLVSCRNVLIYFNKELQEQTIGLFRNSLCQRGFLLLGPRESLTFSSHGKAFESISAKESIYRAIV